MLLAAAAPSLRAAEPPFELPVPTAPDHVEFSADHLDYGRSSATVHLRGHVRLKESTWTLRSEEMWLDLEGRRARAAGFLQMEDGVSLLFGEEGEFDFADGTGRLRGVSAGYYPWRIEGASVRLDELRQAHFSNVRFTSCAKDPAPHYHFRSRALHVRPRRYLYATHAVFYLRGVPVFYTPFLWKSLRKRHLVNTRVSPGYDRRNGAFLRSTTFFDPAPGLLGKAYLDYYGSRGPGAGSELSLARSESGSGAVYGYRIREDGGRQRWVALGDLYQALGSSVQVQVRLQAQSDPDFNNHYSRTNSFRVTPELVNGAALSRATARTVTRLSYSRLDAAAPGGAGYVKARESAPRLEFETAPLGLWGTPWLNAFSAFADSNLDRDRPFLQKSAGAGWRASRTLRLARGASLAPSLAYEEAYESRQDVLLVVSSRAYTDAFFGRYSAGGNLRVSALGGDWDLGYSLRQRLKPGALTPDREAADRGTESSLLRLGESLRPSRKLFARLGTGYDFRSFRDRAPGFRERVQPFAADLLWTPSPEWSVSAREEYQLQDGNRSFLLQADLGERGERFLGLGFGHNLSRAEHYSAGSEFGWRPSSGTWAAGGALRLDLRSAGGMGFDSAQLFEKELWVSHDFHDFFTRVQFRVRPGGVKEASFRVELRWDREQPRTAEKPAPWRTWRGDDGS